MPLLLLEQYCLVTVRAVTPVPLMGASSVCGLSNRGLGSCTEIFLIGVGGVTV